MPSLEEMDARLQIEDVLRNYARGVDRRDRELIVSAFHPDGLDHRPYGPEGVVTAGPQELADRAVSSFKGVTGYSQHHLTNVTIRLDLQQDRAVSECYVLAIHPRAARQGEDAPAREAIGVVGGRYLDRWERRAGRWAILDRSMVVDWSRSDIDGAVLFGQLAPGLSAGGRRDDPSWAYVEGSPW